MSSKRKTGPAHARAKRIRRRNNKKNRCKLCQRGVYLSEYAPTHHFAIPGAFVSMACEMDDGEEGGA